MKNIYFFFTLLFFLCYTQSVVAQNENKLIEYNEFTDLIDVTYFYEDGSVQQIGSFTLMVFRMESGLLTI